MPALTKRWTLPAGTATHIFDGEQSGKSHTGFHSEAVKSRENGRAEIILDGQQETNRRNGLPYWGKAKLFPSATGSFAGRSEKASCFFPHPVHARTWTADYIRLKIEQALTDPGDSSRESRAAWSAQPRQIRLSDTRMPLKTIRVAGIRCGVIYRDGAVETVYPIVEGFDPG